MARPVVKGKVKIGRAKIHDYVLPKEIVYLLGVFGGILLLAGLILVLVGLSSMPGVLIPWGFVLLGLGWCCVLLSFILCCHAFCVKPTRSNPYYINSQQEPRVVVVKKGAKKAQLHVVPNQAAGGNVTVIQDRTQLTPAIIVAQTSAGTTPEYEDRSLRRDISSGSWSSRPTSAVAEKDFDFQYYSANQVGEGYVQQGGDQPQVIVVQQAPQNVQGQNVGFVTVQQNETKKKSGGRKEFYIPSSANSSYAKKGASGAQVATSSSSNEQQVFVVQPSPILQQRGFTPIVHDQQPILVVQQSPSLQQRQVITHQQQPVIQPIPQHVETRTQQTTVVYQDQPNIGTTTGAVLYRPPPSGGASEHYENKTVTSSSSYGTDMAGNMVVGAPLDKPILVQTVAYNPQPQRATVGQSSNMAQSSVAMGQSNIGMQQGQGGQYQNEYAYSYSYQHGDQHHSGASAATGSTEYPRRGSLYDN